MPFLLPGYISIHMVTYRPTPFPSHSLNPHLLTFGSIWMPCGADLMPCGAGLMPCGASIHGPFIVHSWSIHGPFMVVMIILIVSLSIEIVFTDAAQSTKTMNGHRLV